MEWSVLSLQAPGYTTGGSPFTATGKFPITIPGVGVVNLLTG
jgi:hypothetical protein